MNRLTVTIFVKLHQSQFRQISLSAPQGKATCLGTVFGRRCPSVSQRQACALSRIATCTASKGTDFLKCWTSTTPSPTHSLETLSSLTICGIGWAGKFLEDTSVMFRATEVLRHKGLLGGQFSYLSDLNARIIALDFNAIDDQILLETCFHERRFLCSSGQTFSLSLCS